MATRHARPPTLLFVVIAGTLVAGLAVNAGLRATARTGGETVLQHEGRFLRGVQGADSWKVMETARAYTRSHATGLYEQVFFADAVKFQYPPTALLAFGALDRPALNRISRVATLLAAMLVALILGRAVAAAWPGDEPQPGVAAVRYTLAVVAALTFYPLIKGYSLGQIQAWLNPLFAAVILAWMLGARGVAGAALGLMCLVKPTYALLFVWGVVRRETRFVAAGAAVGAAGLAVSLWRYGWHDHADYLRVLSYIARRGDAFYANQSFNGALNRLLFNGANLEWQYHAFAPPHPVVYAGTLAAFVLLGAAALRRPGPATGTVVDLSIAALATTMTAPLAWEHHYGILPPIYAAVTPFVIARRPLGRWTPAGMAASYFVAANYFQFTNHFAGTWLNPLQSYLLAAALLLWALLYRAAHGSGSTPLRASARMRA
jgi:hypothetical protein